MERPNILIVMTDHQRHDTVLSEGPVIAPNFYKFAEEGVLFERAYCPSPHCCPSRATFFSGLYPSQHGVWNNICNGQRLSDGIHSHIKLFSTDLKEAGYQLAYTGKWHVDTKTEPQDHDWKQLDISGGAKAKMGLHWPDFRAAGKKQEVDREYAWITRPGYADRKIFGSYPDEEIKHNGDLRSLANGMQAIYDFKNQDDPWCLYVGWNGPHDPYTVPQEYIDMYDLDDIELSPSYNDMMRDKPNLYQRLRDQIFGQLSPEEVRDARRHFYAFCTWLDDLFGQLLQKLEDTGQADNTLVLLCSDHGDYNGDHGLFAKGIPAFDGAYHIPFVTRWPKGINNPGRRENGFVSLADAAPTFLDIAGIEFPEDRFIGKSLKPFFDNGKPDYWRDCMWHQCDGTEMYVTQRTIRTDRWRFTYNPFDRDELYDIVADPHECNNLGSNPHYQDVCQAMMKKYWEFAEQIDDQATNGYITIGVAPVGPYAIND